MQVADHVDLPDVRRVLVVDHIRAHRDGLISAVELAPGLALVSGVASVAEARWDDPFDVVVVQAALPGGDVELEVSGARRRAPRASIAVMVVFADDATVATLTRRGADLVRSVDMPLGDLFAWLTGVAPPPAPRPEVATAQQRAAAAARRHHITATELEVLGRLSEGASPQAIAHDLGRSVGTVRDHLTAVRRKLSCRGAVDLVVTAHRLGLLPNLTRPLT